MNAVAFVVAYLALSACVLWHRELLEKIHTVRQQTQGD